uniref:Putative ankyrin repeat protein L25 n=1 Tax=Sipha flava TaxID=143950 RepID=A0A2S2QTJ0_9HEMI
MFSLAKLAYMHTNTQEKIMYYSYCVPIIKESYCCNTLLRTIKLGTTITQNQYNIICFTAIINEHMDCLRGVQVIGNSCSKANICSFAAFMEKIEFLKYAFEIGCPWNEKVMLHSGIVGNLNCMKFAYENGCPWHESTCCIAAEYGHLDVLKYAHENNSPWDQKTTESAAKGGHLNCLIYAFENGCPWDAKTIYAAAINSNIECLKYAHSNGCPWNPNEMKGFIRNSTNEIQKYVKDNMSITG